MQRLLVVLSLSESLSNLARWDDAQRESKSQGDLVVGCRVELGKIVGEVEEARAVYGPNLPGLAYTSGLELAHCDMARELSRLGVIGQLDGCHVVHLNTHWYDYRVAVVSGRDNVWQDHGDRLAETETKPLRRMRLCPGSARSQ